MSQSCRQKLIKNFVRWPWLDTLDCKDALKRANKAKRLHSSLHILNSFFFSCRLWGAVNILYCHRCGNYFPCTELGHCSYHPMIVDFGNMECTSTKIVGVYPCCQQRVLHFDPSLETSVSSLFTRAGLLFSRVPEPTLNTIQKLVCQNIEKQTIGRNSEPK